MIHISDLCASLITCIHFALYMETQIKNRNKNLIVKALNLLCSLSFGSEDYRATSAILSSAVASAETNGRLDDLSSVAVSAHPRMLYRQLSIAFQGVDR